MRVYLRLKRPGGPWKNHEEDFEQVPRVGDFIALRTVAPWFKVTLVVWLPKGANSQNGAEVYAVEHNRLAAHRLAHDDEMLAKSNWPTEANGGAEADIDGLDIGPLADDPD